VTCETSLHDDNAGSKALFLFHSICSINLSALSPFGIDVDSENALHLTADPPHRSDLSFPLFLLFKADWIWDSLNRKRRSHLFNRISRLTPILMVKFLGLVSGWKRYFSGRNLFIICVFLTRVVAVCQFLQNLFLKRTAIK
jgi:hypothetical protein